MSRADSNVVVSAFTEEQVERLTGIGVGRLRYWDRTDFFQPSLAADNRRVAFSRIYSFTDVASLRVLAVLVKQYNVALSHLRKVAVRLGKMNNAAWCRTTLYVLNRAVIFDDPEDGKQREIVSGQYMIGIELQKIISDTKKDIEMLSSRSHEQVGKIEKHRRIAHNSSVISGTRVPVRSIKEFREQGYSIAAILKEYPTLKREDIRAALEAA